MPIPGGPEAYRAAGPGPLDVDGLAVEVDASPGEEYTLGNRRVRNATRVSRWSDRPESGSAEVSGDEVERSK